MNEQSQSAEETKMTAMFIVWSIVGCLFIGVGVYSFFAKKALGFWANTEMFQVTDIKKYNGAVAKLFCGLCSYFCVYDLLSYSGGRVWAEPTNPCKYWKFWQYPMLEILGK